MEFRTLKADEIDVKVGTVGDGYYTVLLYKNARVDMAILDETIGVENWQRDHKEVKGNLYCGIGILFANQGWVWKWDCGVESDFGDKQKGEASDSFKRAGFNWGIGRELYTSPKIYINCETTTEDGKHYKIKNGADIRQSNNLKVKEIEYNNKREITKLVIVDSKGIQVYPSYNYNNNITTTEEVKTTSNVTINTKSYSEPNKFVITFGKYKGNTLEDIEKIDSEYLDWLLENATTEDVKKNIAEFRKSL